MRHDGSKRSKRNAKGLRKEMTSPEIGLWLALRRNPVGLRFRKQHAVGEYVLDFYFAPGMLAIEVDGEAHERGDRPARDAARDAWLVEQGLAVLRFPASEVLSNLDGVVQRILDVAMRRIELTS